MIWTTATLCTTVVPNVTDAIKTLKTRFPQNKNAKTLKTVEKVNYNALCRPRSK